MGEPMNGVVMMRQCSVKEIGTTDGYQFSLLASVRKGRRNKSIAQLLELLKPECSRTRTQLSMTHLLGEKVADPDVVNNEEVLNNLCNRLQEYFWETLGLTRATRWHRWNLCFKLVVTNPEGVVIFSRPVLNWTADNLHTYLKGAKKLRKSITTQSFLGAISLYEHDGI